MKSLNIKALLQDMRREAEFAINVVAPLSNKTIAEDPMLSRAIAHALALIGEAANQIPEGFRDRYPGLAWNEARGLRNRIIHGYRTIIPDILIDTVRHDLPLLIVQLEQLLAVHDQ